MPLSVMQIRSAKAPKKTKKLFDGQGMYLELSPSGGKWWRLKYRFGGKEKRISLGTYPDTSLKQAREARTAARALLARGVDPSAERRAEKAAEKAETENTLEAIAREWLEKKGNTWKNSTLSKATRRLERYIFPWLGNRPIHELSAPDLLDCLRRIEDRGTIETAHRTKQLCGQIFRYAIATGRADRDPAADLKGALTPTRTRHLPALTREKDIAELLTAIEGYSGHFTTRCALKLAPLLFVRPGELRKAEWENINLDKQVWRIPADKMKAGRPHVVPLADQAVAILRELHPLTGSGNYVFPGAHHQQRPMSNNAINAALRRMGYPRDKMSWHGFRGMASTRLHEMGWPSDVIERQLAHTEQNKVKAAYNHAEHLAKRRDMMQAWADYLSELNRNTGQS